MTTLGRCALLATVALATAACSDTTGPAPGDSDLLADAFAASLLGFEQVQSSFPAGSVSGDPWVPGDAPLRNGGPGGPGRRGPGGTGAGGGMCGGGLGGLFLGGGFGFGFGGGRFGDPSLSGDCAFDAASGRVVCAPVERNGLTIQRSAAYADAGGAAQSAFDELTTNSINVRVAVSGTVTRRNGVTSTIAHESDRTVAGLAPGSTQRTVNGTSAGSESTSGTNDRGSFTVERTMGDTITGVVVPVNDGAASYPIAGTIVRAMQATVTIAGQDPVSSSRREVVTFDGSSTASVLITRNGVTKNCTLPLPHGRLTCES